MTIFLFRLLLPLILLAPKSTTFLQPPGNRTYELTVYSPDNLKARFDITIVGYTLSKDGAKIPMKLKKENLVTPYQLILNDGKYTATITQKVEGLIVTSKVQGFLNGVYELGFIDGHFKKTIITFGLGLPYRVNRG